MSVHQWSMGRSWLKPHLRFVFGYWRVSVMPFKATSARGRELLPLWQKANTYAAILNNKLAQQEQALFWGAQR